MSCLYPCLYDSFDKKFVGHDFYRQLMLADRRLPVRYQIVPCGQCVNCRINYSNQWAIRCMIEARQYSYNYFLTLTIDDDHLVDEPCPDSINDRTGEICPHYSIRKDAPTVFMKALRQRLKSDYNVDGVRFFACGEYGSQYGRPHYHLILFNAPDLTIQLQPYKKNQLGETLFKSDYLSRIWRLGYVVVGDVTYESCAYVARYSMKKIGDVSKKDYEKKCEAVGIPGIVLPFVNMSRMPGIGGGDAIDLNRVYPADQIVFARSPGRAELVKPPRYYDRVYDRIDEDLLREVKEHRAQLSIIRAHALDQIDPDPLSRLDRARHQAEVRKQRLKRNQVS